MNADVEAGDRAAVIATSKWNDEAEHRAVGLVVGVERDAVMIEDQNGTTYAATPGGSLAREGQTIATDTRVYRLEPVVEWQEDQ